MIWDAVSGLPPEWGNRLEDLHDEHHMPGQV
jgi:hypothetical protein